MTRATLRPLPAWAIRSMTWFRLGSSTTAPAKLMEHNWLLTRIIRLAKAGMFIQIFRSRHRCLGPVMHLAEKLWMLITGSDCKSSTPWTKTDFRKVRFRNISERSGWE